MLRKGWFEPLFQIWSLLFVLAAGYQQSPVFNMRHSDAILGLRSHHNSDDDALVRIGTRASPLALAQAYETKRRLEAKFPELNREGAITIRKLMTKGDSILNSSLTEIGGKGLFTKELDVALLNKEVDICVHSMKDVPVMLPEGTVLPATLEREDTSDVFISKKFKSVRDIPAGAIIGSASLRRQAQLYALNPDLKVVNFRGNVQTRLQKIENGIVEGTLLALAGLKRLGMIELIDKSEIIGWDTMLPAVAQGSIGLHCRSDDSTALAYIDALNHPMSTLCVECERSFLRSLDGNCRTPIAGQAVIEDGKIHFRGLICKPNGKDMKKVSKVGRLEDAIAIGIEAGEEIRAAVGGRLEEYGIGK